VRELNVGYDHTQSFLNNGAWLGFSCKKHDVEEKDEVWKVKATHDIKNICNLFFLCSVKYGNCFREEETFMKRENLYTRAILDRSCFCEGMLGLIRE